MSRFPIGLAAIVLAALLPNPAVAQQQITQTTKPPKTNDSTVDFYLAAARKLAVDLSTLEPKERRVDSLLKLSDAVWDWDEFLARDLLTKSVNLITDISRGGKSEKGDFDKQEPELLFQKVINVATSHDAGLARELAKKRDSVFEHQSDREIEKSVGSVQVSSFLLSEAQRQLKNDAQRSRVLFRQSVLSYVTQEHFWFLKNVLRESPDLADSFFGDALAVLAQRDLHEANETLILASYLFSPTKTVAYELVSGYNTANALGNLNAPPSNPALAKQYLFLALQQLRPTETIPPAVAYLALQNLLPQYQVLAPELINSVYGKLGGIRSQVAPKELDEYEQERKNQSADFGEDWNVKLQKAEDIGNPDLRDLAYFNLIERLFNRKDFLAAHSIVDRITDDTVREKLRDYIHMLEVQDAATKPSSDGFSYGLIYDKIKDPLLRTVASYEVAKSFSRQKKIAEASQLVEMAIRESDKISDEQQGMQAKLAGVALYLDLNQSRAFEISREVFKTLGKKDGFDIRRDAFSLPIKLYGLRSELPISLNVPASLVGTVARMCKASSLETLESLEYIENKETRASATLVAIKSFFSAAKKPETKKGQ